MEGEIKWYEPLIPTEGQREVHDDYRMSGFKDWALREDCKEYRMRRENEDLFIKACAQGHLSTMREYIRRFQHEAMYGFEDEDILTPCVALRAFDAAIENRCVNSVRVILSTWDVIHFQALIDFEVECCTQEEDAEMLETLLPHMSK